MHDNHNDLVFQSLVPANQKKIPYELTNALIKAIVLPWCIDPKTRMSLNSWSNKEVVKLDNLLERLIGYQSYDHVYFILNELTQDEQYGVELFEFLLEYPGVGIIHEFMADADVEKLKSFFDLLISRQVWDDLYPFLLSVTRHCNEPIIEYVLSHQNLGKLADSIKDSSALYVELIKERKKRSEVCSDKDQKECSVMRLFANFGCVAGNKSFTIEYHGNTSWKSATNPPILEAIPLAFDFPVIHAAWNTS